MLIFPSAFISKTIPLRYKGCDLRLAVSHALFSSNRIDDGTMLLLKTLAKSPWIPQSGRVLDLGCGVGPLALALGKSNPNFEVHARDRSVLACAFTAENAQRNGVAVQVKPALFGDTEPLKFDLVVSNIPAKAGAPVLEHLALWLPQILAPNGICAVVIVNTLASRWYEQAVLAGFQLVFTEKGPVHTIFHLRRVNETAKDVVTAFPGAYVRISRLMKIGHEQREFTTVWGLPNFDTLDYSLQTQQTLLEDRKFLGKVLVWEPGQGQSGFFIQGASEIELAGIDLLALKISSANLGTQVFHPVASFSQLERLPAETFALVVVNLHTEPRVAWVDETQRTLLHLLTPGGQACITGTSTDLARFLESHRGLRLDQEARYRGFRSILVTKIQF